MSPRLLAALALLVAGRASAQKVFSAANGNTVVASTEESMGGAPSHTLVVTNMSSVRVIVFGITLTACENIRQQCGGQRLNIPIEPGMRRIVGHVDVRNTEKEMSYRWSFSYRPDSSDERMVAALRQAGAVAPPPDSQVTATMGPVTPVRAEEPVSEPSRVAEEPVASLAPLVASREIDGVATASSAIAPTRQFWVINKSAYPVVVYSFNLATCLNVRQVCGRTPVNVRVPAGGRMPIGRVDAQDKARKYTYDWTYDWRLDTADVRVAAALRQRREREGTLGQAQNLAVQDAAVPARAMTRSVNERYRFKVARESILGSTQVKGGVVQATGACIDPAELATLERDTTITGEPVVAPKLTPTSLTLPMLPAELRDAGTGPVRVVVRWVVDADGGTVPGSASVVESPHGLVSVQACGAVIGARLVPARDAAGRPVRAWVELPLRIAR